MIGLFAAVVKVPMWFAAPVTAVFLALHLIGWLSKKFGKKGE